MFSTISENLSVIFRAEMELWRHNVFFKSGI